MRLPTNIPNIPLRSLTSGIQSRVTGFLPSEETETYLQREPDHYIDMIIIQALADGTVEVQEIILDINTGWIACAISDCHIDPITVRA